MLTVEQNKRLTKVGPGTPMGNFLRRYWFPVGAVALFKDRHTFPVRILGEDLVLYRDRSGTFGLIGNRCLHRGAGMVYGMAEEHGLRCPYHGWLYDETGQCIEQPFEEVVHPVSRPGSESGSSEVVIKGFKDKVRLDSYPVEEVGGLIFAYLGPAPVPLVPRWDLLVDDGLFREIGWTITNCNWLQGVENILDPVHVEWLHGEFRNYAGEWTGNGRRVPHAKHLKIAFDLREYGIVKRRLLDGESEEDDDWKIGHWFVFPSIQKGSSMLRFRVPMDDEHMVQWYYSVTPTDEGETQTPETMPVYRMPSPGLDDTGRPEWHLLDRDVDPQDNAIFASQGAVVDRTIERLGETDRGIILFRKLLEDQMQIAEDGGDPMNVFRDPEQNQRINLSTEAWEKFLQGRSRDSLRASRRFSERYPALVS